MNDDTNNVPEPIPDFVTASCWELARSSGALNFWDEEDPDLYLMEDGTEP